MSRYPFARVTFLSALLLSISSTLANAQIKPGRNPNQPIDDRAAVSLGRMFEDSRVHDRAILQFTFNGLSPLIAKGADT